MSADGVLCTFPGQRAASVTPDLERAHGGSVLAIAAQGGRLWTSGRDKDAAALREWSGQGRPSSSVTLGDLGSTRSCRPLKALQSRNSGMTSPCLGVPFHAYPSQPWAKRW